MTAAIDFRPVILAGAAARRFWPRSRRARAKQVLALDGERTMIQRTLDRLTAPDRLTPLAEPHDVWVITQRASLWGDLHTAGLRAPAAGGFCEPAARNTAPACGAGGIFD